MNAFLEELRDGWRDLLGAMIGLGLGIGCYNPVSSFFLLALEREFHWSKSAAAVSLVALPVTACVLPFAGLLVDRFGVRRVAFMSSLAMSMCFVWLARMDGSLWMFYAAFVALNVLGCATGPVSYTRGITARFSRSRGTALAIALLGIGLAAMILPGVLSSILARSGWRGGYLFFAVAVLFAGLIAVMLLRDSDRGANQRVTLSGMPLRDAIRDPSFWLLSGAVFALSVASLGFLSQLQSLVIEKGLGARAAPVLLSALAASVLLSRLLIGWLLDFVRPERVAAVTLMLAGIGMVLWMLAPPGMAWAVAAVLLIGLSIGAELDFLSFFCARLFGLRHYAAVYGGLAAFFYAGIAAGGITYGVVHDRTGTYFMATVASVVLFAVSAMLFATLKARAATQPHHDAAALAVRS
jgi:nitrate/nitrite transporter NarK